MVEGVGLCLVLRRAAIDHDDAAARRADPHHLAQHGERLEEVVEREARGNDREAAIGIGQRRDIALVP